MDLRDRLARRSAKGGLVLMPSLRLFQRKDGRGRADARERIRRRQAQVRRTGRQRLDQWGSVLAIPV